MELKEFMERHAPTRRKSSLDTSWNDIKVLLDNGYSQRQVEEYLKSKGIEVSYYNLSKYIRKRRGEADAIKTGEKKNPENASRPNIKAEKTKNIEKIFDDCEQEARLERMSKGGS